MRGSSTHQPPSFSFFGITEQAPQAFAPLFDDLFAIGNAGLDRFLFRSGEEVERGHFSSRRHAGRGVLPNVVLVVPATAVFEFVGSGADGEALILDLGHVHFPWCPSRRIESDYSSGCRALCAGRPFQLRAPYSPEVQAAAGTNTMQRCKRWAELTFAPARTLLTNWRCLLGAACAPCRRPAPPIWPS